MNVAVYTMEKVGSSTLMRALQSAGHLPDRVYVGNEDRMDWDIFDRIVTAVRDPIARNISQNFETHGVSLIDSDWPLTWIEKYLEPRTGVNVYGVKFPTVKGWKIYQGYLLIVKTELMSKVLADALTTLCGEGDYQVDRRAKGEEKFGAEYASFLEGATFGEDLLDRMYGSRYAKHFYSPKQIAALRKKWL